MTASRVFLRKIKMNRWLTDPAWLEGEGYYSEPAWLPAGEIRADSLADLNSSAGTISVYSVHRADEAGLLRVAAALIATTQNVQDFDYCLFDEAMLQRTGIRVEQTQGTTPHAAVNQLHFDLVEMTARKAVALAIELKKRDGDRHRFHAKKIAPALQYALDRGEYDESRVDSKLLAKLRTAR